MKHTMLKQPDGLKLQNCFVTSMYYNLLQRHFVKIAKKLMGESYTIILFPSLRKMDISEKSHLNLFMK